MSGAIAVPFKINGSGQVNTVPYGSDAEAEQAIVALVLTRFGERPMRPDFGTPDPLMAGLFAGDIQVGLDSFGPRGITISAVTSTPDMNRQNMANVVIEWTREEDEGFGE